MTDTKKEVSACCGAEVDIRNNEGNFCTSCFDQCDVIEDCKFDPNEKEND